MIRLVKSGTPGLLKRKEKRKKMKFYQTGQLSSSNCMILADGYWLIAPCMIFVALEFRSMFF